MRFSADEMSRATAEAFERGRNAERQAHLFAAHGFENGFEAAKLDAFRYLASRGHEFTCCPTVTKYVLPLVEARMRALGLNVPEKKGDQR